LFVIGLLPSTLESAQSGSMLTPDLRIEGHWVRKDVGGAGSFGGLADQIPPAQITAEAAANRGAGAARGGGPGRAGGPPVSDRPNPVGVPYIVVDRPCANPGRGNGALLINPDSGGIHIIEHKDEVILAGERGGVRHIYLDGRPHPNLAGRVPTLAGHSTGRYEGNALLVDTIGLTPGAVPGGGFRTPETHLRERLEVSSDGKTMRITYTWDDSTIYQKPHSYTYVFDRLPAGSYAFEDWCDAGDPIERQSIVPPPQRP
jgi:hypothetical protein